MVKFFSQLANRTQNKCHTWPFLVCFYSICFFYLWYLAFQSYGALILCFQELCCLDFMILVLFTTFGIRHFGIMLPRFRVPCFIHGICILELCCLDSIITDYLLAVFGIQRIYYTVIMLPRFHIVRTRRPGNSL